MNSGVTIPVHLGGLGMCHLPQALSRHGPSGVDFLRPGGEKEGNFRYVRASR